MSGEPVYTDEEKQTLERGLRILARFIARAYIRDQSRRCGQVAAEKEAGRSAKEGGDGPKTQ